MMEMRVSPRSRGKSALRQFIQAVEDGRAIVAPFITRQKLTDVLCSELTDDEWPAFCITLSRLEGLQAVPAIQNAKKGKLQLRLNLFDSQFRQFFGRTWVGPIVDLKDGAKVSYNQSVYMHTSISDPGILLVFEVVATVDASDKNPGGEIACGWGFLKLFKPEVKSVDLTDTAAASAKRVELHYGSPRALLCLDGEIEGNSRLVKMPNCHLLCAVQTHRQLLKVAHLFPENCIVGQRDVVPGIIAGSQKNPKTSSVDHFYLPKLARAVPCSVEQINVHLGSSMEKFEEELCAKVLQEYNQRQGATTGGTAVVTKRYLRVGVHNGLTYVATPEEVQLTLSSDSVNLNRSGSLKRNHQRSTSTGSVKLSTATGLRHKGRVEVEGLLQDMMFHVVFTLIYDVVLQTVGHNDSAAKRSQAQPVVSYAVRWAAVCPFASDARTHRLTLIGGSDAVNPESVFIYTPGISGASEASTDASKASVRSTGLVDMITLSINTGSQAGAHGPTADHTVSAQVSSSRLSVDSEDSNLLVRSGKAPRSRADQRPPLPSDRGGYAQTAYPGYPPINMQHMQPDGFAAGQQQQQQFFTGPGPQIAAELQEIPIAVTRPPILASIPGTRRAPGLTRAGYARLHAAGFPPILDRTGSAAEVMDQGDTVNFDTNLEERDRLKVNEIVLQFMAFSRVSSGAGALSQPKTVFFSFQFYSFGHITSERLVLNTLQNDLTSDPHSMPFILQRLDRDGTVLKGPPGYQIKYQVDPAHLKPGEARLFVKYLADQSLHIDVWDGDSLLLVGSCVVELKHLCRQGRSAVQVTHELDIFLTDTVDQVMGGVLCGGDLARDGAQCPLNMRPVVTGRLHLRLGNIGQMSELKLAQLKTFMQESSKKLIITHDPTQSSADPLGKSSRRVCKAQHLTDISQELAMLINSRRQKAAPGDEENHGTDGDRSLPAEKLKKLARMEKIRQIEGIPDTAPIVTIQRAKEERSRDLRTIELFRMHCKRDGIMNMLNMAITTEHMLFASMGTTEFFEFVLRNPYSVEHTVQIDWDDNDLVLITDAREWRYFKMLNDVTTPVEEHLFSTDGPSQRPQIFLRPKESISVPFKFLTFRTDQSVDDEAPADPYRPFNQAATFVSHRKRDEMESRNIKVVFRTAEMKQIAILSLRIEMRPHIINQTFRLNHPEHSFLDRPIRLPPLQSLMEIPSNGPPINQVLVRCSDPNVMCSTKKVQPGEPHDVYLKVACGAAPQVKRFFVVSYVDSMLSRPLQIWQFYVHAMQRVDIASTVGQTNRITLMLRGTQSSRLVRCFSSHPAEMQVEPRDPFMLPALGAYEMYVGVRPLVAGSRIMYINVVDVELHQVVRSWLVNVMSQPPVAKKTFELQLPIGGGQGHNKKITFRNPYSAARKYDVMSSHPDLLRIKDPRLELGPDQTASIGLMLVPAQVPGTTEIFVFINDEEGRSEETFSIRATYA